MNFWSEDRSRRCGEGVTASQRLTQGAQQLGIAAVLCGFLAYRTLVSRPCIVAEFNVSVRVTFCGGIVPGRFIDM